MDSIGARIKRIRKEKDLTQVDLGKVLGISGAAIGKIETDVNQPTEAAMRLICATYHVNYLWLTQGKEPMFLDMDADGLVDRYAPNESEAFRATVRAAMGLSDEVWIKWRDFVDDMREKLKSGDQEADEQQADDEAAATEP